MPVLLDHAASTPVRPEVAELLHRHVRDLAGNPSATHAAGRAARAVLEAAREQVAAALGASPHDVVFTSGGTESDNLAVKGIVLAGGVARAHVVTTAVEHPAVGESVAWLASRGADVDVVACRADGTVAVDDVLAVVRADTRLVSVMAANNETGAVNDVVTLGTRLAERGVPLHVDAVQALATRPLAPLVAAAPAVTVTAHKVGGPVGIGVLVRRRGLPVEPLLHGGGQDRGLRSGTLPAALAAAGALAVELAQREHADLASRLRGLRDRLAAGLATVDGVRVTVTGERCLASHVHVTVAGVDGEALAFLLDRAGIACSGGAACAAGSSRASHVLVALQAADPARPDGAPVRMSLGRTSTEADVDAGIAAFVEAVARLRAVGGGAVPTSPGASPAVAPAEHAGHAAGGGA